MATGSSASTGGGASPLQVGVVVAGRFELVEKMGAGGFGEVWRARHKHLGVDVALKVLSADAASSSDVAVIEERFRFEAQVSALVGKKTSHVVAVHDAGVSEVGPFLAMELVVGRSIERMIDEDGPLAVETLVPLLAQLGEALDASHAAGIVHRDLKPANVLVADGPEPMVKLIDFGIAKAMGDVGEIARPKETDARFFLGTPEYMSPEQVRTGAPVSAASDIWALGILAYEALTEKIPFGGASAAETMVKISERSFTPPSHTRRELTPAIDAWFTRALAKDPAARFASGREAAAAFANAARARVTSTPARGSRPSLLLPPAISIVPPAERGGRGGWLLAAIAVGCLFVATLFATSRPIAKASVARRALGSSFAAASTRAATFALAPTPATRRAEAPAPEAREPAPSPSLEPTPETKGESQAPRPPRLTPSRGDPSDVL
jgi:eukaryotic-like serine/threonine-protein kinase